MIRSIGKQSGDELIVMPYGIWTRVSPRNQPGGGPDQPIDGKRQFQGASRGQKYRGYPACGRILNLIRQMASEMRTAATRLLRPDKSTLNALY